MNKVVSIFSLFLLGFGIVLFNFLKKEEKLYEAKWNPPDTTLAITINGEIKTTFPTTNAYETSVECTNGTGKAEWNGSKWVLTTSNVTKGNIKCNVTFKQTLRQAILANNEVKTPLTTPGQEVSAHTKDDVAETTTINISSTYRAHYITYGTGYEANGTKINLTGTAVTSGTYANSYSSLVGKYLVNRTEDGIGSATAGTMRTTTDLYRIYYVVSATSSSLTYKQITSNKKTTEALLATTPDDYGTSYYFRGAVKNNYVQFANKCWKIVRITGDGSVKLVLHNDNTSNVANPCSSVNNSDDAAFAHNTNKSIYNSAFNLNYDDNVYMGFMYGTAGSSNYASTHANINKSTILTNLESWYGKNLISYGDKLADIIWCNDKSTVSGGLGYGANKTDYGAYNRLRTAKTPSLKCPNDNNGGKLSKFTVSDTTNGNGSLTYKIGLLTADEITFSGAMIDFANDSIYLNENADGSSYRTMTPYYFMSDHANVWAVSGGFLTYSYVNYSSGIRPSIAITSSTTISGGSGTSEDPYIVD